MPSSSGPCLEEIGLANMTLADTPVQLTMDIAGAVLLVMVTIVLCDYSQVPQKWRGGTCLISGFCPNPILSFIMGWPFLS